MLPRLLLLLSVLGPGNCLQLWDTWEQGTKAASRAVRLRERRQADVGDDFEDADYVPDGTDPPELLTNTTNTVAPHPEPLTTVAMLEQRVSGTPESATAQVTATSLAGPDAGGLAVGMLSTESAPQWKPTTVETTIQPAATEAETSQPAATEAETSQPAATEAETSQPTPTEAETSQPASTEVETSQPTPTEAETSQPAATEAETSQPAATEAETSQPTPTEAETSQPASMEAETSQPASMEAETSQPTPTEAETSQPAATEAETSQPAATEAETSQPAPTEAETSQPASTEAETTQFSRSQVVKSRFTESTATEFPSTEPTAKEITSTEPTDSTIFLGPFVSHKAKDEATGHFNGNGLKNELLVTPGSSLATTTPVTSDLIPVKQCLLAILILASLATIFLVCTVVLAVRLSRKNHMYPVRNYSPTEMICISSLLPEGGDGAPVTANGDLPKVQDLKTEPSEDRDEDDLTLRSFLP